MSKQTENLIVIYLGGLDAGQRRLLLRWVKGAMRDLGVSTKRCHQVSARVSDKNKPK